MKIFIQILGIVGSTIAILAFQAKKHKYIMLLKCLDSIVFAVHWALLKDYTSLLLTITSIVRNLLFAIFVNKKINTTYLIIGFAIINVITGILTYTYWTSIIKAISVVMTTISFGLKREKWVRILTIPACLLGVLHASMPYHFSIGGIITESFTIISIIIAMIRFRNAKPKNLPNSDMN